MDDLSGHVHSHGGDTAGQPRAATANSRPTLRQAIRQCPPGGVVPARRGTVEMAVARLPSGEAFAVPDHCPHAGVPLSEGFVEDGQLVCPMHGWAFELPSGRCVARPEIVIDVTRLNKPRSRPAAPLGQQSLDLSHESAHESARESAHESAHESARES